MTLDFLTQKIEKIMNICIEYFNYKF
jgi:hypothetical protein